MILHKTELAINELSATKRTLSLLERRILLFADGVRNVEQIRELVNNSDTGEQIYLLEKKGFLSKNKPKQLVADKPSISVVDELLVQIRPHIVPITTNSFFSKLITPVINTKPANASRINAELVIATPTTNIVHIEKALPLQDQNVDERTMSEIKRIITDICTEYLGIFSRDLLDKTHRAQNSIQLRACISQWHMAMLESKTGRENCFDLLNEVNELFNHGIALELKIA